MQGKPKITISNFSGMHDNGSLWCEGFDIKKLGGQAILSPGWGSFLNVNSATTNFTSLENINDFCQLISNGGSSGNMVLGIGSGTTPKIFGFNASGDTAKGLLYTTQLANNSPSYFPSLLRMKSGNILFPMSKTIGIGYFGTATGGSATTLVDSTKDFDALGFSSTAGYNKIYNITKSEARTITTALNETLTFSSGTTYAASDKYIAFNEGKFSFTTTEQYGGQVAYTEFRRQSQQFNDAYYILNGNFIAKINSDEVTFDEHHKGLPARYQAWCFDSNQEKMLVGAEFDGKGRLLLWDGYASGWINIVEIDKPPVAIANYKSGFIYLAGNSIYYTDGYSIEKMSSVPGSNSGYSFQGAFSSIVIIGDDLFIGGIVGDSNRITSGLYRYNINSGWYFIPTRYIETKYSYISQIYALFYTADIINQSDSYQNILYSASNGSNYSVNKVLETSFPRSIRLYLKLPQKMNIGTIELNIGSNTTSNNTPTTCNVTLNYGEGKNDNFSIAQTTNPTTTTSFLNGYYPYSKSIGDLLLFTDVNNSGQRSYITDISNQGLNTEVITFSPAITNAPTNNSNIKVFNLKKAGTIAVDEDNIQKEINFTIPSFYSDKLFLEVYIDGSSIDIHSINIY